MRDQIEELGLRSNEPQRRWEIIEELRRRRMRAGLADIDYLPVDQGADSLFVRDEIITVEECVNDPDIWAELGRRGFRDREPVLPELLPGLVRIRVTGDQANRENVLATVSYIRDRKFAASLDYLIPLAVPPPPPPPTDTAVGKGIGGPITVRHGLPPFEAYRKCFPPSTHDTVVAVIDGGVTETVRTDGWLADVPRVAAPRPNVDPLDELPVDGHIDLMAGHGTLVAGIIARVAPYAEIRMYKTARTDGLSSTTDVAEAMLRAAGDGAKVINLSLGSTSADGSPPVVLEQAMSTLRDRYGERVVVVAAAGNNGDYEPVYPAALPGVVSVAGLTSSLCPTAWSTRGWVTASTVGEGLLSTYVDDRYLRVPPVGDPVWARSVGTSFAAPQIAAAVARICYEDGLTPEAALTELSKVGIPVPDFGWAVYLLPGMP